MDLSYSEKENRFRAGLRQWLQTNAPESWRTGSPTSKLGKRETSAWLRLLAKAGYSALTWPEEYGGQGLPMTFHAVFLEETARFGVPEHLGSIGLGMVGPAVLAFGTTEQKSWLLPRIASGEVLCCQGFSEAEAGSDLAAIRTRARVTDGELILDGHKCWSSYAIDADWCLLLVRTDEAERGHRGLSCVLLDLRSPGVSVRPTRQLTGEEGFGEIDLDAVRVPRHQVVGDVGDGWRVAMTTLAYERGTFGYTLSAGLDALFERLVSCVERSGQQREPAVRDRIASLAVGLAGLRWTCRRVLFGMESSVGPPGPESSIIKLSWTELDQGLTALATDVVGSRTPSDEIDTAWLDFWYCRRLRSRFDGIEGGTSEILRDVIAERVLGLPRSRQPARDDS